MEIDNINKKYEKYGYVIIRNLISEEEAKFYREQIDDIIDEKTKNNFTNYSFAIPDGIRKYKVFWPLIWHKNIKKYLSIILGKKFKFAIHNDIHRNQTQEAKFDGNIFKLTGWHRDTRFRGHFTIENNQLVFDESKSSYKCGRLGIYLNDFKESGSSLYIIPFSHNPHHSLTSKYEKFFWYRVFGNFKKFILQHNGPNYFPYIRSKSNTPYCTYSKPIKVEMNSGDAVLFDTRVLHSVSPRTNNKHAIFIDYGLENEHTFDYINYYINERSDLKYLIHNDNELEEELKRENLLIDNYLYNSFKESPLTGRHSKKPEKNILSLYNDKLKSASK